MTLCSRPKRKAVLAAISAVADMPPACICNSVVASLPLMQPGMSQTPQINSFEYCVIK